MATVNLTAQRLRELLSYDPETGELRWRQVVAGRAKPGGIAGHADNLGYIRICIGRKMHFAHRLAWLYAYGEWPTNVIDHINGHPSDNRIANLRDVTHAVNCENGITRKPGISGLAGAHRHGKRWAAHITMRGKAMHLGTFDTPEEAHQTYLVAKRKLHKGCTI